MKKKLITLITILLFSLSFAVEDPLPTGLSQNQTSIIKTYTLKALNLSLEAYNKVKQSRLKKAKPYIESAIFFLNEASMYSPSYPLRKKVETLYKTMEIFPDKYYKESLISILYDVNELAGSLITVEKIKEDLQYYIDNYSIRKNPIIKDYLKSLEEKIKLPLIDDPLKDAKTFLAIAYDNLRAGRKEKVLKSLEISFSPMNQIAFRENLLLVKLKNSIYTSYLYYTDKKFDLAKAYLQQSQDLLDRIYKISSSENKELIKGIKKQLNYILDNFQNEEETVKEYIVIIRQIKNL